MSPDGKIDLLIVEDDRKLAELIREYLEAYEFSVALMHTGIGAADSILVDQPGIKTIGQEMELVISFAAR